MSDERDPDQPVHSDPFVWPPRPAPDESTSGARPGVVDAPPPMRPRRARMLDAFAEAERFWLAPTAEPLARRAAQVGWSPDTPDAYCNRCGETVGAYEADEFCCAACRDVRWPWDRFVRLGAYEGPLRDWIHEVKFTRWRRLGVDLGRMLGRSLRAAGLPQVRVVVAPTPTPFVRRLRRGVDHARAVGEGASQELGAPLVSLLRARAHRTQRSLPRSARSPNVSGVFQPLPGARLDGWTVVVVDDVRTTGSTLAAQCRAIRKGWPDVENLWAATLGVTPSPARRAAEQAHGSEPDAVF